MKGLFGNIDLNQAVETVHETINFEYRDPLLAPYGKPEKMTSVQKKAWEFLHHWTGFGPQIAMIAAKGAAKTHFGGCFALHQMQKFPESVGCLVSNTYAQAKDNGLPLFIKICRQVGYDVEFFPHKKVRGRQFTNVAVVTLAPNVYAYLLIRSYDAIQNFEGIEIDWWWSEEGQHATWEQFQVPYSRNRGQLGDNAVFYAAMPEDGGHWQYKKLPMLGMVEEKKYVAHSKEHVLYTRSDEAAKLGIDPIEVGIMYEFSVFDNIQNVGKQYIQRNSMAYSGVMYDWYVLGKRGSSTSNKIFDMFNYDTHVNGMMSKMLTKFDPHLDLYWVLDFNVAPGCSVLFQKKPWNDKWEREFEYRDFGKGPELVHRNDDPTTDVWERAPEDLNLVYPANRYVYAQVGEIETWRGGTRGHVQEFVQRYSDYKGQLIVNGDAAGNAEKSSSTTTDWAIISQYLTENGFNAQIQKGLIVNHPDPTNENGKTTYSNPPRRDTFNVSNGLLMDGAGASHICFLPESEYESNGLWGSVSAMKTKPDGTWDESCDKQEGRDVARTHFSDGFRYFCYLVTGGKLLSVTGEDFEASEIMMQRQLSRTRAKLGGANRIQPKMTNSAPGVVRGGSRSTRRSRSSFLL